MGFSTSAVVAIFTVSLIYMTSMFYPVVEMYYNKVQEAEKTSNELRIEKLNTKINITDWTDRNLTVYNDGSITLDSSKINVILEGVLKSKSSFWVGSGRVWAPKTSIVVENIERGSNKRVKIIAANGAADYMAT
jgi:archaellum component FlaF (FlaF/FlaG flagellin family)